MNENDLFMRVNALKNETIKGKHSSNDNKEKYAEKDSNFIETKKITMKRNGKKNSKSNLFMIQLNFVDIAHFFIINY